ncbi:MAG TPA: helix-turn-helix domain-containing protein [Candidatus Limnocylindrales bacterium]|nr:helix-turn-helix domain-containing protein [Candidatus Limnocylindrales bacterium]
MHRRPRSARRVRLGVRIGAIVRAGREGQRWTKTNLGERSGISRQMVAALESGKANPSLDVIGALLEALEIELDIVARGPVEVAGSGPADAAHAICSAYVQRRLVAAGWQVEREVRITDRRYLGWIDILAFHPQTATLVVIEVKTRIDDVGAIERSLDWHVRGATRAAERLGWRPRRVIAWVVALASDEVEDAIRRTRELWATAFPARASAMRALAADPATSPSGPSRHGIALIDPMSRRSEWLIRTRVDGRRSNAPYRGYADFMARIRLRR